MSKENKCEQCKHIIKHGEFYLEVGEEKDVYCENCYHSETIVRFWVNDQVYIDEIDTVEEFYHWEDEGNGKTKN